MSSLAKTLIFAGGLLAAAGLLVLLLEKTPLRLGRLPGDLVWKGNNTTFYFPVVTCLLLSILMTLLLSLWRRR